MTELCTSCAGEYAHELPHLTDTLQALGVVNDQTGPPRQQADGTYEIWTFGPGMDGALGVTLNHEGWEVASRRDWLPGEKELVGVLLATGRSAEGGPQPALTDAISPGADVQPEPSTAAPAALAEPASASPVYSGPSRRPLPTQKVPEAYSVTLAVTGDPAEALQRLQNALDVYASYGPGRFDVTAIEVEGSTLRLSVRDQRPEMPAGHSEVGYFTQNRLNDAGMPLDSPVTVTDVGEVEVTPWRPAPARGRTLGAADPLGVGLSPLRRA